MNFYKFGVLYYFNTYFKYFSIGTGARKIVYEVSNVRIKKNSDDEMAGSRWVPQSKGTYGSGQSNQGRFIQKKKKNKKQGKLEYSETNLCEVQTEDLSTSVKLY